MSVITVGKNGRVYQRKFDWDEARARYQAGELISALARAYGVTNNAVIRAVDADARAVIDGRRSAWIASGVCEDCGKQGVTNAKHRRVNGPTQDGRVLCIDCRSVASRTRFRFDSGVLTAVCCGNIDCASGERWQPPGNFPGGTGYRDLRPKGIHSICRACNTRNRRECRRRNREASNAYDRAQRARRRAAA